MLTITLQNGRAIQRVFGSYVTTETDLDKFIKELKSEFGKSERGSPIFCEILRNIPQKELEHAHGRLPTQDV